MKKIVVKQNEKYSCAVACVLSLIRYYGGNIGYGELSMIINTTKFGTNALDMLNGVKSIGFDGRGIKSSFEDFVSKGLVRPLIAHVEKGQMYHFVVVYEINERKKTIKVMDPGVGLVKLKFSDFEKMYLGTLIDIVPVDEIPNISERSDFVKYFYEFFKMNKKFFVKIVCFSVFALLFSASYSVLFKYVFEFNVIWLFILVILLKNVMSLFQNYMISDAEVKIGINLMDYLYRHLFRVNSRYIKNKSSGEVGERIREVEEVKNKIIIIGLNIFVNILLIVSIEVMLIIFEVKVFLISLLFIMFVVIISLINLRYFKKSIVSVKENVGVYEGFLNEVLVNYNSIRNMKVQDKIIEALIKKYYVFVKSLNNFQKRFLKYSTVKNIIGDLFVVLVIISLLVFGSVNSGDVLFLYSIMISLISSINVVMDYLVDISEVKASFDRVNDLFVVREEVVNKNGVINGDVLVSNLGFGYVKSIFSNLNFVIKRGEVFLLYGPSGSGKSTFFKVLTKELLKYKGNIYIGGVNLKDINKSVIDNSFTFVSQEEHLFNDTLENNIKFFRDVSDEEYEEVLKVTMVDKIRDAKEFRNEFLIYEDGVNLSGGERQKVILARALLKKCEYIILDEAMSEVNYQDEIKIISNIRRYFKDKTIIYVSHKEEIAREFDKVYTLKGGDEL